MKQNPIKNDWTPKGTAQITDLKAQNAFSLFAFLQWSAQYLMTFAVY